MESDAGATGSKPPWSPGPAARPAPGPKGGEPARANGLGPGTFGPAGCLRVVRPLGLLAVSALALSGATRAAPGAGTTAPGGALRPSGGGRPTLVVATGARLDSIDPETGDVLGSLTPITVPGFTWKRFLRRGRFLLAQGESAWVAAPVWHSVRGLALIDDAGAVRWTDTHVVTLNRASRAVFLDDDGNVAFDRIDGPTLILRDGTRLEIAGVPRGPVLHGPPDLLPVGSLCERRVDHWLAVGPRGTVYGDGTLPASLADRLPLRPTPDDDGRRLELVQVVEPAPEDQMYEAEVKTVARLPLPAACRHTRRWTWPTMSPRHWLLQCEPEPDEDGGPARPGATFVVDLARRGLRRVRPPASDVSALPREFRRADDLAATVLPDGTILASVWNDCSTEVYLSTPAGGWKRAAVDPPFGPQFAPEVVCGRLTLQPTLLPPNMGCSSRRPGPASFVRRPDGAWLPLPYGVAAYRSASCSPDGEVVAFVAGGALTTARLDRPERKSVRPGLSKDAPLAWLP
jgi:hypothetical protein